MFMSPFYQKETSSNQKDDSGQQIEMEIEFALRELTGVLKRRRRLFLIVLTAVMCAGMAYAFTAARYYTATAHLLIDARHNELLKDRPSADPSVIVASPEVDSQVEIMKSGRVARTVIRKLNLLKSGEFERSNPLLSPIAWIKGALNFALSPFRGQARPADPKDSENKAVEQFGKRLTIERVALTYVVEISARARSPQTAAEMANAVAEAYLAEELNARDTLLKRANAWLYDRIQQLRRRQIKAEQAVADYRAQHNIVDTGGAVGAVTRTVSNQQLVDINSSLTAARAHTAEALAKWRQIQQVVAAGDIEAPSLSDAANNPNIQNLRQILSDLERRRADRIARVGARHRVVARLSDDIDRIRHSILDELRSVEGSVRNEYEVAMKREETLAAKLNEAIKENESAGKAGIQLRDLEREAQATRTLYETYLNRYVSASAEQSFPISEARVLAEATPPLEPSHPKKMLILGISFVGGGMLAFGSALVRDRMERGFTSRQQVQAELGVPLLGMLPLADPKELRLSRSARRGAIRPNTPKDLPQSRQMLNANAMMRISVNSTLSRFADALRSIRMSCERAAPSTGRGRIIGFVSATPHEGKSTTAVNFAQLLADSGERVLLVDADFRRAALTAELAPREAAGAIEVVTGALPLPSAVLHDAGTGLEFLSRGQTNASWDSSELATSKAFLNFVEQLRTKYSWAILDLPPLVPVIDANAVADAVDGFVLVIEWRATARNVVFQSLAANNAVRRKLLGCAFNKVDVDRLAEFEPHMKQTYYSSYYEAERVSSHPRPGQRG
jgi:succinoglycan biosynthesis transport protein ExoP